MEKWRQNHNIQKSTTEQEIRLHALWLDQHPEILLLDEEKVNAMFNKNDPVLNPQASEAGKHL